MAATGAVRAARRAGSTAAMTVTTVPTATLHRMVVGVTGRLAPMSTPIRPLRAALAPWATATPSRMPSPDPTTPTMAASPSTLRSTWPREAPRARSSASSRERWPMSIEKVFTMMKAPTNRATPAKASKMVVKKLTPSWMADAFSAWMSAPVTASAPAGSTAATASRSSS